MEPDDTPDLRRLFVGTLGAVFLVVGLGVAIWAITVIRQALYHPDEIPLLHRVLDTGTEAGTAAFDLTRTDGELSFRGSQVLVVMVILGLLLAALGGIVSALLSGGARLLSDATWRGQPPRARDGRPRDPHGPRSS